MQILGDFERFAATSLYPLRFVLVAIAIAAAIGLLIVASRRGWVVAARRHPGRSGVILAVALAIVAPAAWYLGSPLFVRTELQEPPQSAVGAAPGPASPGSPVDTRPTAPTGTPAPGQEPAPGSGSGPTPAPASAAAASPLIHSGTFTGSDDFHFGRGRATLVQAADGGHTLRFDGFSVRNGPDLYVYLSPDASGYAAGAIELGRLRATDGSFNVPIPPGTDVGAARSVVIWCKQFAVLFAVAPLDG